MLAIEVLKDSEMNKKEALSLSGNYSNQRKTLIEKEIVQEESGKHIFIEVFKFPSPSAAAAILLGYSINGRVAWQNDKGARAGTTIQNGSGKKRSNK
jgi:hypothetical protein